MPPRKKKVDTISAEAAFVLPETMTIDTVEGVLIKLNRLSLREPNPFTVDASATALITTPGVQLLISLAKTLEQAGNSLQVHNIQNSFTESFQTLGLSQQLESWSK